MNGAPLKVWLDRGGRLLRLRLARPKANVLDAAMIGALAAALGQHRARSDVAAVLVDAEGPHFSFGASVEEHLPAKCASMLAGFHALLQAMLDFPAPILVAVRGQCLGGGLELASAGALIFAAPDAKFGQPEINLGVIAPAASCLLPARIGPGAAGDLLLSGRSIDAAEAARLGLAAEVAGDPEAAGLAWFDRYLAAKSAAAVRFANTAARGELADLFRRRIAVLERLYLDGVMATRDALEGLNAFLEKRAANWEHR
ncbi:MAG TPA: cyclohexa-1,5-dienecarbonyl-CoA hydratase [Alphaproteobacteria bacterium]|jgi:cyclohexa-1,5-dienecarbonyl-CoA hydratase